MLKYRFNIKGKIMQYLVIAYDNEGALEKEWKIELNILKELKN